MLPDIWRDSTEKRRISQTRSAVLAGRSPPCRLTVSETYAASRAVTSEPQCLHFLAADLITSAHSGQSRNWAVIVLGMAECDLCAGSPFVMVGKQLTQTIAASGLHKKEMKNQVKPDRFLALAMVATARENTIQNNTAKSNKYVILIP